MKDGVGLSVGNSFEADMATPIKLGFHCDSSSHRGFEYMVAGGLAVRTARYKDICAAIQRIKDAVGMTSEMKWSEYRGGHRRKTYEAAVDMFFSLIESNEAHFHCMVANFAKFSHKSFEGGTPESSVNRMYYQLLVHRVCKAYARKCYIFCYPDKGVDGSELAEYLGAINFQANQRYKTQHKLALVEQRDSKLCNLTQMVDVIIGGIAHRCNNPNAEAGHKKDLADYVYRKAGVKTWLRNAMPKGRRFTVWHFQHQNIKMVSSPKR
jgi:hypothetical protein